MSLQGRCECSSIRFESDADIIDVEHCHCSQCRRLHGAAFASFAGVPKAALRFIDPDGRLTTYASSANVQRFFCSNCGSTLACTATDNRDRIYLSLGAVDGAPPFPVAYHAFVDSKAPWYEIGDSLPQYPADPPPPER